MHTSMKRMIALAIVACAGAACRTAAPPAQAAPIVQPGAPGQASAASRTPVAPVAIGHVKADVAFMQGMISHHAQALEMVRLLETRSDSADMKLLAQRIKVSQSDEIKFMQDWLRDRGESVPGEHAHHAHGFTPMPGMLSAGDMKKLEQATGRAFDRLFLEYMITHHEGALVMVDALFRQDGAGQEAMIHAFASDVVADQQMEIIRMMGMLREMQR